MHFSIFAVVLTCATALPVVMPQPIMTSSAPLSANIPRFMEQSPRFNIAPKDYFSLADAVQPGYANQKASSLLTRQFQKDKAEHPASPVEPVADVVANGRRPVSANIDIPKRAASDFLPEEKIKIAGRQILSFEDVRNEIQGTRVARGISPFMQRAISEGAAQTA